MMNQDGHDGRWHSALGAPKAVRSRAAVPWVIAGLAVVAGAALAGATTAAAARVTVGAGAAPTLYVTSVNSGSVTQINTAPLEFVASIQAIFAGTAGDVAVRLRRYVTAGARHIVVRLAVDGHEQALAQFADHVLPLLRMGELA